MSKKHIPGINRRRLAFILVLVSLTANATAQECTETRNDIPCEMTIPTGTLWWDYFHMAGNTLLYDDECGMRAPAQPGPEQLGETWVSFDLPHTPHLLRYEMYLERLSLVANGSPFSSTSASGDIVVLEMLRDGKNGPDPVLELRLNAATHQLELTVYGDQETRVLGAGQIKGNGSRIAVELSKSTAATEDDGMARLFIDDQPVSEIACFRLWNNLPTEVRIGVVQVESGSPLAPLTFQPISYSHQLFAKSP